MQILEQRAQRTGTCLWMTKAYRPMSHEYMHHRRLAENHRMDSTEQHKSSGQVVLTYIIVVVEIYMRLRDAFQKIISLLLVVRVPASCHSRATERACECVE